MKLVVVAAYSIYQPIRTRSNNVQPALKAGKRERDVKRGDARNWWYARENLNGFGADLSYLGSHINQINVLLYFRKKSSNKTLSIVRRRRPRDGTH